MTSHSTRDALIRSRCVKFVPAISWCLRFEKKTWLPAGLRTFPLNAVSLLLALWVKIISPS